MILLIKVFIFFLYLWSITEWQLLGGIISQWHALTSTSVLHYQVQSLLCFYHLKELDCRWKEKGKARGMEEEGVMGQGNKKRTKGEAEQRARMKAKRGKKNQKQIAGLTLSGYMALKTLAPSKWRHTWTSCFRVTHLCWDDSTSSWSSPPGRAVRNETDRQTRHQTAEGVVLVVTLIYTVISPV